MRDLHNELAANGFARLSSWARPVRALTGATSTSARILELDALRGFAAAGVLALHTYQAYFFWAWSCVDLFFILSGFLITGILLANAGSPRMLLSFYARRALRIWPVYYLTFVAATTIFLLTGRLESGVWPSVPAGHWASLVFLQHTEHYWPGADAQEYIWYFQHSWSLAVEEQFYLLWPLAFMLFGWRPRLVAALCGAALLASAWARSEGVLVHMLVTRVDGLLFGIVLAYLAADRRSLLYRMPARYLGYIAAAGVALLLPYMLSHGAQNLAGEAPRRTLEVTAFCMLYSTFIAVALRWSGAGWLAGLRWPPFIYLGRISFAFYMYQVPIGFLALLAVSKDLISVRQAHVLMWIGTFVAAHLSYRWIEGRVLALKPLFPYARERGAAPSRIDEDRSTLI